MTPNSSLTYIRAEMARRGLLTHQLQPWWSPDSEGMVDPLKSGDVQREVRRFMAWLDGAIHDEETARVG